MSDKKNLSGHHYERIRKALAMAPTPGPWVVDRLSGSGRLQVNAPSSHTVAIICHNVYIPEEVHAANAAFIAACDPDTVRALLAERDELAEQLRLTTIAEVLQMTHTKEGMSSDQSACAWRCFHCDEVFTDREKARLHFGDEIDAEPGCAVSLRKYREMEAEIRRLRRDIEAETTSSRAFYSRLSLLLKSYRPFRQCSDLQDVFNVYDSMEGRALAAEEKLQERSA